MYKVCIEKKEYNPSFGCDVTESFISIDAVKPYGISDEQWNETQPLVQKLAQGEIDSCEPLNVEGCLYTLNCVRNDEDFSILAESEHYYILSFYEDAVLYRKPDSKRIACVGNVYGDPDDAYIDPAERFCITVGCGLIRYNIQEPFEDYMNDRATTQWVEIGRKKDAEEWCDLIENVTDSYIEVSCDGEDLRRFDLETLKKVSIPGT